MKRKVIIIDCDKNTLLMDLDDICRLAVEKKIDIVKEGKRHSTIKELDVEIRNYLKEAK